MPLPTRRDAVAPSVPPQGADGARLRRLAGGWLAGLGLVAILAGTLHPKPAQVAAVRATPLLCLLCGDQGGVDVFVNLLFFMPLAAGLRLRDWSWRATVAAAALLSLTVELLQYTVVVGRDASLSDLLTNTTGAALAAWFAPYLGRLVAPSRNSARRLLLAGGGFWLGILAVSAWLLSPATAGGTMASTWPEYAWPLHRFGGELTRVRVNGVAVAREADLPDSAAIRQGLDRGRLRLEVEAISGPPLPNRDWLYTIRVPWGPLLVLTQDGRDVLFAMSSVGLRYRLRAPTLRLRRGFPADSGVPVELQAGAQDGRLWLASSYQGRRRELAFDVSPSHAWSAVLPWGVALGPHLRLLTGLWVGALLVPLGYWAGFLGRRAVGLAAVAAAIVVGLGLLPPLAGFRPVHWSEWLASGLGAAFGWALHWPAAYLQTRCGSPSTSESSSS